MKKTTVMEILVSTVLLAQGLSTVNCQLSTINCQPSTIQNIVIFAFKGELKTT